MSEPTRYVDMSAIERAEVLNMMSDQQLIEWGLVFELSWNDRPRAVHFYPQIVVALCNRLRAALTRIEDLEGGPNPCADPFNPTCDCVHCEAVEDVPEISSGEFCLRCGKCVDVLWAGSCADCLVGSQPA